MTVVLYTVCWNDARMIPYFFRHYDPFVDRYVIYDDGSTDGSQELIARNPKAELRPFHRTNPDSFELSLVETSNSAWKEVRGEADWVFVVDMDEHVWHPDMADYLKRCRRAGVTFLPVVGYQMVSRHFTPCPGRLCDIYRRGATFTLMCKPVAFDPREIGEINFWAGRHMASPTGRVVRPQTGEAALFHYKYIGFNEMIGRNRELLSGLRPLDIEKGWGYHYSWTREEVERDWRQFEMRAVDLGESDPAQPRAGHLLWWAPYPAVSVPAARHRNARKPAPAAIGLADAGTAPVPL